MLKITIYAKSPVNFVTKINVTDIGNALDYTFL